MLAVPPRDGSVFQQIFAEHWEAFQQAHTRYQTPYYDELVAKMLACGHPTQIGSSGRDCSSVNRTLAMGRASCHCLVVSEAHHTRKKAG